MHMPVFMMKVKRAKRSALFPAGDHKDARNILDSIIKANMQHKNKKRSTKGGAFKIGQ